MNLDDVFTAIDAHRRTLERLNDANAPVEIIGAEVEHGEDLLNRMWDLIWREINGKGRKKGRRAYRTA